MREIIVQIKGEGWDDEGEADEIVDSLCAALDNADFDYLDATIKD